MCPYSKTVPKAKQLRDLYVFVFKKIKTCFIILMVPPVVSLLQATCKRDGPRHLQLICFRADAMIVVIISSKTVFKRNSVSTINSALLFNGTVSQVRKGNPWIKMHPDFKRSTRPVNNNSV